MNLTTELISGALVVLLVCLLSVSNVFRYYTKFALFLLITLCSTSMFIPLMVFRPRSSKNALLPAWMNRQVSKVFGLKWKIRGKENIVQNSGAVILLNHQSVLDVQVLSELWPIIPRCTVIAKKELFFIWPFGLACWLWGTIFINRLNSEQSHSVMNSTAETISKTKAKLCLFPEGTRHDGKELLPFKKGAFHVAVASQTPLQPIVVSRYHFLDAEKHIFNSGTSLINILPPIPTEGMTKEDIPALMGRTHSLMSEEYKSISNEILLS